MLNAIDAHYKPTNSEFYIELMRQLHNIIINFEKNIRQYKKDFRKINIKIINLNDLLSLSKSYLIQLFLIKLDEIYDIFITIYT